MLLAAQTGQADNRDFSDGLLLPSASCAERNIALASRGHCTAHSVFGDGAGFRMQGESALENSHFYILNARPDVVEMREQVYFHYGWKRDRHHIFDVLVTFRDGSRIAYTIKPARRTTMRMKNQMPGEDFLTHMQMVAGWVEHLGFADDTRLLTEEDIDPVALHNAHIFAAVREADPKAEALARSVVAELLGGIPLQVLTLKTGLGARGYRALLRLIRLGELIPAQGTKISPQTIVYRKGTYQ